jgi:[acyl-carrier-protein] S-malonyltransferase
VIIAVFPGQGSQTPGFLAPWLKLDGVRERLESFSDESKVDLIAAGTEWDADRIRDTRIAQPLIVAASLVSWEALAADAASQPAGFAGHSVGEIAALVAARVVAPEEGMRLVGLRGRAMADAAALTETGMSAIIGGDETAVLDRLRELDLTPANYNGAGQIVAAGTLPALAALSDAPVAGTRVIPLPVAGAFHTTFMEPAVETLRAAAAEIAPADPAAILWTNSDGSTVDSGRTALDLLVAQVASPVRWDRTMTSFADRGVTGLIEFAPAGTLTGLAKRALRGTPAVAVKTPDDLAAAAALLKEEAA